MDVKRGKESTECHEAAEEGRGGGWGKDCATLPNGTVQHQAKIVLKKAAMDSYHSLNMKPWVNNTRANS